MDVIVSSMFDDVKMKSYVELYCIFYLHMDLPLSSFQIEHLNINRPSKLIGMAFLCVIRGKFSCHARNFHRPH